MKYIVKTIATATDDNPNFKGEVHTYFIARDYVYDEQFYAEMNAWKRRWAAEKWIEDDQKFERNFSNYWTYEYEIIEVQ